MVIYRLENRKNLRSQNLVGNYESNRKEIKINPKDMRQILKINSAKINFDNQILKRKDITDYKKIPQNLNKNKKSCLTLNFNFDEFIKKFKIKNQFHLISAPKIMKFNNIGIMPYQNNLDRNVSSKTKSSFFDKSKRNNTGALLHHRYIITRNDFNPLIKENPNTYVTIRGEIINSNYSKSDLNRGNNLSKLLRPRNHNVFLIRHLIDLVHSTMILLKLDYFISWIKRKVA